MVCRCTYIAWDIYKQQNTSPLRVKLIHFRPWRSPFISRRSCTCSPPINNTHVNTLRRRQNGGHFIDEICNYSFLNGSRILIPISTNTVFKRPIRNTPQLVRKWLGDELLTIIIWTIVCLFHWRIFASVCTNTCKTVGFNYSSMP